MIDRKKVINELVSHIENALSVDSDYVDCIPTDLLQYAVALLKKQESRVLTLDELTRERQLASLALWLADAVFEDDWDSNPEFYREIACRKLEKLGYVQVKDYGYVNTVTEMLSKALENMEKKEQNDETD